MAGIRLDVSADAALVIFDLLSRWEEAGTPGPALDLAEWTALSELLAVLERSLSEPFLADYRELVEAARVRISQQDAHE